MTFKITCLHFLMLCGVSLVGSRKPRFWNSEVWVIRRNYAYHGYLRVRVLSFGGRISYVSVTDFTKLFWSGDAYFGKQGST